MNGRRVAGSASHSGEIGASTLRVGEQ
jgi:hypothetical protein